MTRQEHEALAAKALAWLSGQWISDKELEAFIIATLDESTGLVYDETEADRKMLAVAQAINSHSNGGVPAKLVLTEIRGVLGEAF